MQIVGCQMQAWVALIQSKASVGPRQVLHVLIINSFTQFSSSHHSTCWSWKRKQQLSLDLKLKTTESMVVRVAFDFVVDCINAFTATQ